MSEVVYQNVIHVVSKDALKFSQFELFPEFRSNIDSSFLFWKKCKKFPIFYQISLQGSFILPCLMQHSKYRPVCFAISSHFCLFVIIVHFHLSCSIFLRFTISKFRFRLNKNLAIFDIKNAGQLKLNRIESRVGPILNRNEERWRVNERKTLQCTRGELFEPMPGLFPPSCIFQPSKS